MPKTQATYLVPKKLLGTLTAEELRHLKRRVVAANRAMGYWYQQIGRDCMSMTLGHVSAKVPGTNTFVTKGRAPDRDLMSEVTLQKLVQVDITTNEKVAGEMEVAAMAEIELHSCVYEARPDVVAVCHGHADHIQLWGLSGLRLKAFDAFTGLDFVANGYGVYNKPYLIATPETGKAMVKALGKHSIVLLAGHGAATVSTKGPEDAIQKLIQLEQLCKMNCLAYTLFGKDYEKYAISDEDIREHRRPRTTSTWARGPSGTPGQDLTRDQCFYNAAMVKTFREAVDG